MNRSKLLYFWVFLTILVRPLRVFLTQDDATYAKQAILFATKDFRFPADTIAPTLPQTSIGAFLVSLFGSSIDPIIILNGMTWIVFLAVMLVLKRWLKLNTLMTVGLISVPYWLQYGCGFLYDLYVVLLEALLLWLWDASQSKPKNYKSALGIITLSALGPLQLQTLFLINGFLIFTGFIQRKLILALYVLLGSVLALIVIGVLPSSLWQQVQAHIFTQNFLTFQYPIISICSTAFQFLLGIGFFLLPLVPLPQNWSKKKMLLTAWLHIVITFVLWLSPISVLAAGAFFSDYLPRVLGAFLVGAGVWGWSAVMCPRRWSLSKDAPIIGVILLFALIYGYRAINDMRYAMILMPLVFWSLKVRIQNSTMDAKRHVIGGSVPWVVAMWSLSIFLNSYLVDTSVARWSTAHALEKRGVPVHRISAGYGRDHFELEDVCIRKAYAKLGYPSFDEPAFMQHIHRNVPRVYQDEWVPEYILKPYRLFGVPITLKANQQVGQHQSAEEVVYYKQLGLIPHQLAVFKNDSPQDPWCLRP